MSPISDDRQRRGVSIDDARAAKLIRRVRELVAAGAVDFNQPHCRQRMQERRLSITQVLTVLRDGEPDRLPRLDDYGCWRIRFVAVIVTVI